ncbi:MAG: hypothetical protein UW79_C0023G0016 [Candidatus Yanofskybacteria bacterium GW2011_GWA2_44_9]|nr:MAG: hypothetical protein UW79_C0023G0016 [Candidatus Yanofskybacteria bacterium GW2011_GWA2_44_9]
MTVDALSIEEAVSEMKGMMSPGALAAHMADRHAGENLPTMDKFYESIEKNLKLDR